MNQANVISKGITKGTKLRLLGAALLLSFGLSTTAQAEEYLIDTAKRHAFIQFKIQHLGYSWLLGEFPDFKGSFTYDAAHPESNEVNVNINVASIDTHHAERNKHLRSSDFFDVEKFPTATFTSTSYEDTGNDTGIVHGVLKLRGVSKKVDIQVKQVGTGPDPWGGYRRGFEGHTTLHLSDYNMKKGGVLGAAAENVELFLSIEGIRQ